MRFHLGTVATFGLVFFSGDLALGELLRGAFKVCRESDPDLNRCVVDSINGVKEQLATGIPELGLPPFTDLHVDEMKFEGGPQEIHAEGRAKNCSWIGFQDFNVTGAKMNLDKSYIELQTFQPKLTLDGYYSINGTIVTLRIFGKGQFKTDLVGVNATHRILLEEVQRDGITYWKVTRYQWMFDVSDIKADIKNLYGGNERLTKYANQFINSYWRSILEIYKEVFYDGFGEFFRRLVNKLFDSVPKEKLILP